MVILGGLGSATLRAQAISVIGGGQDASDCSLAATEVALGLPLPREALERCTRALDFGHLKRRDLAATYSNRGIVYTADGKFAAALDDFNKALTMMPMLPQAYIGRGNAVFLSGDPGAGIADYQHALELGLEEVHIANFNLGLAFEKLGNLAMAQQHFQSALEQSPGWSQAQQKLDAVVARRQTSTAPN